MSSFSESRLTNHLFVSLSKLLLILQKIEGQLGGDVTSLLIRKLTNDYDQVCSKSFYCLAGNIVEAPKKIRPKSLLKNLHFSVFRLQQMVEILKFFLASIFFSLTKWIHKLHHTMQHSFSNSLGLMTA